jgi:hypothetical protein
MAAPRKYPDELRERATRLAVEARRDPASAGGAIKRIADQLGVHPEANASTNLGEPQRSSCEDRALSTPGRRICGVPAMTGGGAVSGLTLEQYFRQFAAYTPFDLDDEVCDVRN